MLVFRQESRAQVVIREQIELGSAVAVPVPTAQQEGQAVLQEGLFVAPASGVLRLRFRNAGLKNSVWEPGGWPALAVQTLRVAYKDQVWEEDVATRFTYGRAYRTCYDSWDRSCCIRETFYAQSSVLVSGYGFVYRRSLVDGWSQEAEAAVTLGTVEAGEVIDLALTYVTDTGAYELPLVLADPVLLQGGTRLVDESGISLFVDEPPPDDPVVWGATAGYWSGYAPCVGGRKEHLEVLLELVAPQQADHFVARFDPATLRHGEVAEVFVQAKDAAHQDVDLGDEVLLNLSLVKGSVLGGLRRSLSGASSTRLDRVPYGSVRAGKSGASGAIFVADGENPVEWSPEERAVVLVVKQEEDPAVNGTVSLEVKGRSTLVIEAVPDTIGYGQTAVLRVRALEPLTGAPVSLPDDVPLLFTLAEEGAAYGHLVPTRATYGVASTSGITFTADGVRPDSVAQIEVYVQQEDDPGLGGVGRIVVEDRLKLEIELPQPKQIWPTLPGGPRGGKNKDKNNVKDEIVVRVMDAEKPVAGHLIKATARFVRDSGGHGHAEAPPAARRGIFNETAAGEFEGLTDANGELRFSYRAPAFGGEMELIATIEREGRIAEARETITVRVPDLILLPPDSAYALVGGPDNHSGTDDPCRGRPPDSQHLPNHFGTPDLIKAIRNIVVSYGAEHPGVRLRINDMSLSHGGLFDIENDWQTGHAEHRIGKQADIGFAGVSDIGTCVALQKIDLHNEISHHTTDEVLTHGDHYHIRMK